MQIEREQRGTRLLSVDVIEWVCGAQRREERDVDMCKEVPKGRDGGVQYLRA